MNYPFEPYITADSTFVDADKKRHRMITMVVPWPTVKLAELRTHRTIYQTESEEFSLAVNERTIAMNANSSRAIPLERQIKQIEECPFEPFWTLNQKGMSGEYACDLTSQKASEQWHSVRAFALTRVKELLELGIHKQDAALLLNPFSWTTCILSASEHRWQHFFDLRTNVNVFPAVREICQDMESLMVMNHPKEIAHDELSYLKDAHMAFQKEARDVVVTALENGEISAETFQIKGRMLQVAVSMSMCAMISYDTQQRKESLKKHVERANKLVTEGHWSTAEHQFIPVRYPDPGRVFPAWKSYREILQDYNSFKNDLSLVFND